MAAMVGEIGGPPRAFLVVTAHWEEARFTLSSGEAPGMFYDYGGFPEHTYRVKYPAPGDPALAARVAGLLEGAGLEARLDPVRGFDHGTFSTMQVVRPEADVPVVQLSLRRDFDPAAHLLAGRALAPLRDEGVLIIGSGASFHNLQRLGQAAAEPSVVFDRWLQETLTARPAAERELLLADWEQAPAARLAHAREEHLLPLMVAAGAAPGEQGRCVCLEPAFMGVTTIASFRFG